MKNEHLIPSIILDLAEKSNSPIVRENEKMNYILRLEAIRDYCSLVITKHNNNKSNIKSNMRKVP
jgi:hypothetical protein